MTSLLIFYFFWFVELVLRQDTFLLRQTELFEDLVVHYMPSIGCKLVQYKM